MERGASADEIRSAYRRLARRYHPDVSSAADAAERFKEVSQAYEILSDAEKRQRYDMFGESDLGGTSGFGIDDLFNTFFGGTRRRERGPVRGADLRLEVELDLEDVIGGVERTVRVPRQESCEHCHGSGAEPGAKTTACATCGGRGEVRQVQQSLFGRFVSVATCPRCAGAGKTVDQLCRECRGEGRIHAEREVSVTFPPGIDDGQQIRVGGQGEAGMRGGPPGDLYVLIRLREHALFRRDGDDVVHVLRITPAQAALGDDVTVPTIEGPGATVKIPAGAQHGQSVRLRGKGVPRLHAHGRGDQLVYLDVVIPRSLTKAERALYQKLKGLRREADGDEDDGILGKVRDAFGG